MSKRILKNTPSQSRERPLSLQLPPAAIGYYIAKRNPTATITHHHTTKSSTSDYTCCKRIIGKTTHHNLPHYNIVGKSHDPILPPCGIIGKGINCNPSPYNIVGNGHAHSPPPYNIAGKGINCKSPPCDIVSKGSNCNPSPYNIARKGHATIFLLNIIAGEAIFRDNER